MRIAFILIPIVVIVAILYIVFLPRFTLLSSSPNSISILPAVLTSNNDAAQPHDKLFFTGLYQGINSDNEGLATLPVNNKMYFIVTLNETLSSLTNGTSIRFHNLLFSFDNPAYTPGGILIGSHVTFPDGSEERLGIGTLPLATDSSPYNAVTSLTQHTNPQAGLSFYKTPVDDKIKILVNVDPSISNPAMIPHETIYRPILGEIEVCNSSQADFLASHAIDVNSKNNTADSASDKGYPYTVTPEDTNASINVLKMQFPLKLPTSINSTFPGYKLQALWSHSLGRGITLYYSTQPICPSTLTQSQMDQEVPKGAIIVGEDWEPQQPGTSKEFGLKYFISMRWGTGSIPDNLTDYYNDTTTATNNNHLILKKNEPLGSTRVHFLQINNIYWAVAEDPLPTDTGRNYPGWVDYFNDNDKVGYHIAGMAPLNKLAAVARSIPR
jgi:hypothetical protein